MAASIGECQCSPLGQGLGEFGDQVVFSTGIQGHGEASLINGRLQGQTVRSNGIGVVHVHTIEMMRGTDDVGDIIF